MIAWIGRDRTVTEMGKMDVKDLERGLEVSLDLRDDGNAAFLFGKYGKEAAMEAREAAKNPRPPVNLTISRIDHERKAVTLNSDTSGKSKEEPTEMPNYQNDQEMLDDVFSYHAPDADQVVTYQKLRSDAKSFAKTILDLCPPCADRSAAIRLLRECVMTTNASIALKGRV